MEEEEEFDDMEGIDTSPEAILALEQSLSYESNLIPVPTGRLSFSQLTVWDSCPRRYYYRYVLKQRSGSTSGMALGTLTHGAVEHSINRKIETGAYISLEEAYAWIDDSSRELSQDVEKWDEDAYVDIVDMEARRARLAAEARLLAGSFMRERLHELEPRTAEFKIETVLRDRIAFVGFIDMVVKDKDVMDMNPAYRDSKDQTPHPYDKVLDLKTVKKNYGKAQVENSLQLSLYAAATGCNTVGFELVVRPGATARTAAPRVISWPENGNGTTRSAQEIKHALDYVEDIAEAMAAGSYPRANPESWVCNSKWCEHFSKCRGAGSNETAVIA